MGRAGGGHSGGGHSGGHHSGGGHSGGSHSSGGHHTSVRAGSGGGGHRAGSGYHGGSSVHHRSNFHHRHNYYGAYAGSPYVLARPVQNTTGRWAMYICIWIILYITFLIVMPDNSVTKSTIERTKLETGNSFINDCIIDELGWFDNVSKTESQLKSFWEDTGIQPYIILRDYDSSLTTDSQKEQWAVDYYEDNFVTENIFLYVYFAERNTDEDVGYMCYVNGYQTSSVMDSEAIEIFWDYVDKYWYSDLSTDDMFIKVFNSTADTIMRVSATAADIVANLLVLAVVLVIIVAICVLTYLRFKRKKEEADEKWRILNTPLETLVDDSLQNKYL